MVTVSTCNRTKLPSKILLWKLTTILILGSENFFTEYWRLNLYSACIQYDKIIEHYAIKVDSFLAMDDHNKLITIYATCKQHNVDLTVQE